MLIPVLWLGLVVLSIPRDCEGQTSSSIAIDPDREQLLKDALGWMTFRKNGELMPSTDVESLFLDTLIQKYTTSKLYRTFVIAFQLGVLPRLTLNEKDSCSPDYKKIYQDRENKSVTWYSQKDFTFGSYDKRDSADRFCDYRKGLVCNKATSKCECPHGSKMEPISSGSPISRCLLQENEVCALIDIDHGSDPKHSALAINLNHLIFSLEKPLSCKFGSQCRFKDSNLKTPLCYSTTNGPWHQTPFQLDHGEECAIGLYADQGSCKVTDRDGPFGLVCFNFGPPRSIQSGEPGFENNRVGFCFHQYGIFSLAKGLYSLENPRYSRPLLNFFLHPRNVPLRGIELEKYYEKYKDLSKYFTGTGSSNPVEVDNEGDRCSVSKTDKMMQVWNYFHSLDDTPSSGKDFATSATNAELQDNMQALEDLATKDLDKKMCRVYWNYVSVYEPKLKCVTDGTPDANGNDGKCEKVEDTDDVKKLLMRFGRHARAFRAKTDKIEKDLGGEKYQFRKDIFLENPDPPCMPLLGPLPPKMLRHHNPDTLVGGHCPDNSVCYQDFSDEHDLYDSNCEIKADAVQVLNCHDVSSQLGTCEGDHIQKKVDDALDKLDEYAKLEKGSPCHYEFEKALREKEMDSIAKISKYQLLNWIERGVLCDKAGRNLECSQAGMCECIGGKCKEPPTTTTTTKPGGGAKPTSQTAKLSAQYKLVAFVTWTMLLGFL